MRFTRPPFLRRHFLAIALWLGLAMPAAGLAPVLHAEPVSGGSLGVGVVLGEPSGLSMRYGLDAGHVLDAALAFSVGEFLEVNLNRNWTFPNALPGRGVLARNLSPYAGVGGALLLTVGGGGSRWRNASDSSSRIGAAIRIPIGVEWTPEATPLGIFAELAPGIGLLPGTFALFGTGVGIRYYF